MKRQYIYSTIWFFITFLFLASLAPVWAGDGALDLSFDPGAGVQKLPMIRGQANYPSIANSTIIYGFFNQMGGVTCNSVARLTNGAVDNTFTPAVNGEVRSVYTYNVLNTDPNYGKTLIAGQFSITVGADTYYNLARLTSAGALDTTFPKVFNDSGAVNSVDVSALTSTILVVGYSLTVPSDTTHAYHLVRLDSGGSFVGGWSAPGGYVTSAKVFPGDDPNFPNKAQVFCMTPNPGGGTYYAVLLDTDLSSVLAYIGSETVDGPIYNLALQSDGKVVIVGNFRSVYNTATTGWVTMNHVARLGSDLRTLDTSYIIGSGANGVVTQITPMSSSDDRMVLSGGFTDFNGTTCGRIVRLTATGSVDTSFTAGTGANDRIMRSKGSGSGWTIYGYFRKFSGSDRCGIATLTGDGILTSGFSSLTTSSNTTGTVYALEAQWGINGPQLILGGDFTGVGGKFHQNLARLNPDGSVDGSFSSVVDGQVNAIRTMDGGQMLIAGKFGQAQGYGCTSLARLNQNGSFDTTFRPIVTKGDGTVAGLRMVDREDSGNFDIGGNFATVYDSNHNPLSRNAFAVLNPSGYPTDFTAQFNIPGADKIKVNAGGNLGNGYGMVGYARINNSENGFACALNSSGVQITLMLFDGEVLCGTGLADGRIVVGGNFTHVVSSGSVSRNHIAAITSSFTLDSTFAAGAGAGADGPICGLRTQGDHDNGKPLIAGAFTTYNGVGRAGVARLNLDGSLDNSFNPGSGTGGTGTAYGVTWFNNRAAFGGAFTSYNGITRPGVAQVFASMGASPAPISLLLLDQ